MKYVYIGKIVKAEEDITDSQGVINIYGERWEARSENGEVIPAGPLRRNTQLLEPQQDDFALPPDIVILFSDQKTEVYVA